MLTTNKIISSSSQWVACQKYMFHRVKEQSFNTWIKPTKGELQEDGTFLVAVRNQFVYDWILAHYRELIEEAVAEVVGQRCRVSFVSQNENGDDQIALEFANKANLVTDASNGKGNSNNGLSQRYNFESL